MVDGGGIRSTVLIQTDRFARPSSPHNNSNSVVSAGCRGHRFIHSKGIVHNDIAACNILFSSSMDINICDFGVATRSGRRCCVCRKQGPRDIALGLPMRISFMTCLPLGHCFTRFYNAPNLMKTSKAPKPTGGSNHPYFRR